MKTFYEKELNTFKNDTGASVQISKSEFVDTIGKVWFQGLSEDNVKAGFRATGIVPLDPSKYSIDRLNKAKMITYRNWQKLGKCELYVYSISKAVVIMSIYIPNYFFRRTKK